MDELDLNRYDITEEDIEEEYLKNESIEEERRRIEEDPSESIVAFNMGRGSPISQFFESIDSNSVDPYKAASELNQKFNKKFDSLSLNTRKEYLEHVIEVQASRLTSSLRFYEDEMQKALTYSTTSLSSSSSKSYDLYKTPSGFIPRATHYDTYSLVSSQESRSLNLRMSMYQIQDVYTVAGLSQRKSSTEIVTQSFINSNTVNKLNLYMQGVPDPKGEKSSLQTNMNTVLPNDITVRVLEKSYSTNRSKEEYGSQVLGVGMPTKANLHAKVGYLYDDAGNTQVAFITTQNPTATLKRAHTVEETLILRRDAFGAAKVPEERKQLRYKIMEELKAVTDAIVEEALEIERGKSSRAATDAMLEFNRERAEISFKNKRKSIQDKFLREKGLAVNNSVFVGEEIQNRLKDKVVELASTTGNTDKLILSVQYIESLFNQSENSRYKENIKTPLLTSLKTLAEQGRVSIALTGSSFGKGNGLFSVLDRYYDGTITGEEKETLSSLLEKGAFSLMPSKYAHSKSMVVLNEQDKLVDFIIGSSNLSRNAYENNFEVALGLDQKTLEGLTEEEKKSIQNYYYYGVSHFKTNDRKRQTNYTMDRSSKTQTEELIKVLRSLGGVESRVKGSDAGKAFDFSFSKIYNIDKGGELSGVEIHIKGPDSKTAGYSFSVTVGEEYKRNREGKLETVPIVYLSKNNRVINGMIYVNHSKETLKLYDGTKIKPGEAKDFSSFEVVSGLITTMKHMMTFEASRKSLTLALGKMDNTARMTSLDKVLGIMLYKEARSLGIVEWKEYKGEGFKQVVEILQKNESDDPRKVASLKNLINKVSNLLIESSLGIENPNFLASRRKDVRGIIDAVPSIFASPINSLLASTTFLDQLDNLMMTSLDKEETATLYSDLLRLIVYQDPIASQFYRGEQQRIKKTMFSQITSPFAQAHELYYGFGQALYKKPTFGINQELYLLAQSQRTLGFLLSPHPLKHNEPLLVNGNMFLRGKADSRYFKESNLYNNLGGIYNVAEGAASIKDLHSIVNTMRNIGVLNKEDYKGRLRKAYKESGLDDVTIDELVETQTASVFKLELSRNKRIDNLLYFPFRAVEQTTERLRTQQSGRPVDSASTEFGIYADTLGVVGQETTLDYNNLLDSTFLTTLPPHQFEHLKHQVKKYVEEGFDQEEALEAVLTEVKRKIQSDGLSLVRGFVGARAPKRMLQSVGISTMSDFAYVNQGYLYDQKDKSSRPEYVLHHRTSLNLDQTRLLSNVDFRRLVSTKLTKGVSFLAKAQKIENKQLKTELQSIVLKVYEAIDFTQKEFTKEDSIKVLEITEGTKTPNEDKVKQHTEEINKVLGKSSTKESTTGAITFDKIKSMPKGTRATIEKILELSYGSIRFDSAKGEFYFKPGVFSAAEGKTVMDRLRSVNQIGNFEEGSQYFTIDGFYEYIPLSGQQRRTQKIKFKLPATSQREYRGVSFLTEDAVLDHSGSSTVSLELKTATRRDMVSNLRPGTDTAKGPAYMIGAGVFEQIEEEQRERKVKGYSLGEDLLPNRIKDQKIYAILSPSQVKGFNFEQGLLLLEDDNFIDFIKGGKRGSDGENPGVSIAEGLALIMLGSSIESKTTIATLLGERFKGVTNKKQASATLLNPNFKAKVFGKQQKGNNISASISQNLNVFGELNSLALPELLKNKATRSNALELTVAIALGYNYVGKDGVRIEEEAARLHLQRQALKLFDIARNETNAIKYGDRYIFDNSFGTRTASLLALITKFSQDIFVDINQSKRLKGKSIAELNPGFFLEDNVQEGIKKFNLVGQYNTKTTKALKESVIRMGSALNITFNDSVDESDEEQVKEFQLSMYQLNALYRFNRFLEFGIESIPSRVAVAVGMQNMTKMEGQYVYELSKRQVSLYTSEVHHKSDVLNIQQAVIMLGGMMEGQMPDPYRASNFYSLKTLNLHFVHKQSKDFLFSNLKDFDIFAKTYTDKAQSYINELEKNVLDFMSLKPEVPEVEYPETHEYTDEVKKLLELEKFSDEKKISIELKKAESQVNERLYTQLKLRKELDLLLKVMSGFTEENSKAESLKANIDLLSINFSSNFLEINENLSHFKKLVTSISIEELNKNRSIEKLINLYDHITTSIEALKTGFKNREFVDYLNVFFDYTQQNQVDEIHKHPLSEKYYERMQTFAALQGQIELFESKIQELISKEQESAKKVRSVYLNIAPSISKIAEQKAQYETYKTTGTVEGVYTSPLEFTLNFLTAYSKFSERTLPAIIDNKAGLRAPIAEDAIYNYVLGNFGPATQLVQEMAAIKTIVSGYSQHSSLDSIEGISNRRRLLEERILRDLQLDPEKKKLLEREFILITEQFARKLAVIPSITREQVEEEVKKEIPSIRKQVKKELQSGKHVGKNWYGFNIISRLNSTMMSKTPDTIDKIVDRIVKERIRDKYDNRTGVVDKTKDKFLGTKSQTSFLEDVITQRRDNLIALGKNFMPSEYFSSFFSTLFNKVFGYHETVKDFEDHFSTRLAHPELIESELTHELIRESGVYEHYQKDLEDRIISAQVSDPASEYLHEGMELVRKLSYNLKHGKLDDIQKERAKGLYESITKTQRIILPQLLVLGEDFKKGTYSVTYAPTDKYKPAEGLLLGLDIMQKLSLVFQTQSSKALQVQMQLAFELQSSFGLLAKITKQAEEGQAVIISRVEYEKYQGLVALLGNTLTETYDLLRNQETIRQAGAERLKVTGISSIAMSTLLASQDEIVAGTRFFQVAREGTDSVISSKKAQRMLKKIRDLYQTDQNKSLQLINKLRGLYLTQNNIIDPRQITIEQLNKINSLMPKNEEELNSKKKRELNSRIEDYLLKLVLEKKDLSSVEIDTTTKEDSLETRREKNLKLVSLGEEIRATMIRQGAPFGSSLRSRTGHILKTVLSHKKLIKRGEETGTHIVPDENGIGNNTLVLMSALGSHYTQMGDNDGDSFQTSVTQLAHITAKITQKQAEIDKIKTKLYHDANISQRDLEILVGSSYDQLTKEAKSLEAERKTLIKEYNKLKNKAAEQSKQGIRKFSNVYTAIPKELMESGNVVEDSLIQSFVLQDRLLQSFVKQYRDTLDGTYGNSGIVMRAAGMLTTDRLSKLKIEREEGSYKINEDSLRSLNLDSENERKLKEEFHHYQQYIEDLKDLDEEQLQLKVKQEIANLIAHSANTSASIATTTGKILSSALGAVIDEQALTELQAILGSSGGSLLGTTFNTLVPLVSLQMAETAAHRSMFSSEINSYKLAFLTAINNRISKLSSLDELSEEQQLLLEDAERQRKNLMNNKVGVLERIKFEKAERQVDVALRFVVTTQQFLRDAGLKPKEVKTKNQPKSSETLLEAAGVYTLTDEESNKYGISIQDQVVGLSNILSKVTGTIEEQSKSRDEIITKFLTTKLGSKLNLLDNEGYDLNFKTIRAFGALKLMSEYVGGKFSSANDMYNNSVLSDILKSAHSTQKYEKLSVDQFLPEFITDIYSKYQTDYIINNVLELENRTEFNKKGKDFLSFYGIDIEKSSDGGFTVKQELDSSKIQAIVEKERNRFDEVDNEEALEKHLQEYQKEIESRARAIQNAVSINNKDGASEDGLFKTALETAVTHLVETDAGDFKKSLSQLKRFHDVLGKMEKGERLDDLEKDLSLYNQVFAQRLASGHVDSTLWTGFFANYLEELQYLKQQAQTEDRENPSRSTLHTTGFQETSLTKDTDLLNYKPTSEDKWNLIKDFANHIFDYDSIKKGMEGDNITQNALLDKKINSIKDSIEEKLNAVAELEFKTHPDERMKTLKQKAVERIRQQVTKEYKEKNKATKRPSPSLSDVEKQRIGLLVFSRLTKKNEKGERIHKTEAEYMNEAELKEYNLIKQEKKSIRKEIKKEVLSRVKERLEGHDLKTIYNKVFNKPLKTYDVDIENDLWGSNNPNKEEIEDTKQIENYVINRYAQDEIKSLSKGKGLNELVEERITQQINERITKKQEEVRKKEEKKISKLEGEKEKLNKQQQESINKLDSLKAELNKKEISEVNRSYKVAQQLAELSKEYLGEEKYNSFIEIIDTIDSLNKSAVQYAAEENAFTTVTNDLQSEYNRLVDQRAFMVKEGRETEELNKKLDSIKQELEELNRSKASEILASTSKAGQDEVLKELTEALDLQTEKISKEATQQHLKKEVQKVRRINAASEAISLLAIPTLFSFITDPGSTIGQVASGITDLYQSYLTSQEREGKDASKAAESFRANRIRTNLLYSSGSTQSFIRGLAFEGIYQASSFLSSKALESFYKAAPKVAAGPIGRFAGELLSGVVGLSLAGLVTNRRAGLPNENYTERDEAEVFIRQIMRNTQEALNRAAEVQVASMSIDVQDNDGSEISAELSQSDITEPGSILSAYEKNIILNIEGQEPEEIPFDYS